MEEKKGKNHIQYMYGFHLYSVLACESDWQNYLINQVDTGLLHIIHVVKGC